MKRKVKAKLMENGLNYFTQRYIEKVKIASKVREVKVPVSKNVQA